MEGYKNGMEAWKDSEQLVKALVGLIMKQYYSDISQIKEAMNEVCVKLPQMADKKDIVSSSNFCREFFQLSEEIDMCLKKSV